MGSAFNPLILMDKLVKLNSSQQSIETLSHWCIFHMNKAKQVVETWDRQYHCSPREQRLAFLYLANDILQNSRRKGAEFVGEFWKVLPDALRDAIENGDEFARNAALRLISIWDERKVFGSRGQILKDEFVGRYLDISNRNAKPSGMRLRPTAGNAVEKIVSSYQLVYGGQLDEDSVLNKCKNAINTIEKVDKEIGGDLRSGHHNGSTVVDDLKGQHTTLRDCIEQLTSVELSRANLVAHLREALQEQEYKLEQVRNQLQAAHAHSDQAEDLCRQLSSGNNSGQIPSEHGQKENHVAQPHDFVSGSGSGSKGQSSPVMYTRQVPFAEKSSSIKDDPKSAAAAMAAKLTASSSSAEMLTYVLSSLASEGVIGNQIKESLTDFPPEKRPKLDDDKPPPYIPTQSPQPHIPPFSHSESVQHSVPPTSQDLTSNEQPPPPSSPPPVAPLPPMHPYPVPQYIPTVGTIPNGPYGYGAIQQQPGFPPVGPPTNGAAPFAAPAGNMYQSYPTDGSFYSQASSLPMAPVSRQ